MRLDDDALRTVFRCFDMDHSGGIDLQELHSAIALLGIPHMTKQKVEKMFGDADQDGNGEIDFGEVRIVFFDSFVKPSPPSPELVPLSFLSPYASSAWSSRWVMVASWLRSSKRSRWTRLCVRS